MVTTGRRRWRMRLKTDLNRLCTLYVQLLTTRRRNGGKERDGNWKEKIYSAAITHLLNYRLNNANLPHLGLMIIMLERGTDVGGAERLKKRSAIVMQLNVSRRQGKWLRVLSDSERNWVGCNSSAILILVKRRHGLLLGLWRRLVTIWTWCSWRRRDVVDICIVIVLNDVGIASA